MKKLHWLAIVTLCLATALVTLGGVVHNTGSSLACPDWPLCFGQVFPKMEGSVAIEHSHRLLATLVGLLTIGLSVLGYRVRTLAPKLYKLSLVALGLVVFQGVLGGMTVLLRLSTLFSTAHLATSQIFLATLLYLAIKSRSAEPAVYRIGPSIERSTVNWLRASAILIFLQMVLGAFIRHSGASVACGLGAESMLKCIEPGTEVSTWWPSFLPAQFGMLHRYVGFFAVVAIVAGTLPLLRWARHHKLSRYRALAISAHLLVLVQVVLGLLSLSSYLGPVLVTLHLDIAMALWLVLLSSAVLANEHRRAFSQGARPTTHEEIVARGAGETT